MHADRWHILGAGAIGSLCTAALLDAGQAATLVLRDETALARWQASGGLHWTSLAGERRFLTPQAETASQQDTIRALLLCTKAYDAREALGAVVERLAPGSPVVLLVNGLGVREELLAHWPGLDIFPATTTEGALRLAPFDVKHTGTGTTLFGQSGTREAPPWFEAWQAGALAASWSADIDAALWQKLAINCAINPLTALHRCPNGELATPALAEQVRALCKEIATILSALSYKALADHLEAAVFDVIRGTAANRSSMLQDLEAGRRTEVDYITGHLVSQAAVLGLKLPHNEALLAEVRALEPAR